MYTSVDLPLEILESKSFWTRIRLIKRFLTRIRSRTGLSQFFRNRSGSKLYSYYSEKSFQSKTGLPIDFGENASWKLCRKCLYRVIGRAKLLRFSFFENCYKTIKILQKVLEIWRRVRNIWVEKALLSSCQAGTLIRNWQALQRYVTLFWIICILASTTYIFLSEPWRYAYNNIVIIDSWPSLKSIGSKLFGPESEQKKISTLERRSGPDWNHKRLDMASIQNRWHDNIFCQ
jgi:hypothetical protein